MEKQNFEKKLEEMAKPEIHNLKHEDILSRSIINAKDKSVVSWWWLSVPVFIILMLLMKSTFMPGTTLISNMHELGKQVKNLFPYFLSYFSSDSDNNKCPDYKKNSLPVGESKII